MSDREDFLVELGTEELPPKALLKLATSFAEGITAGLTDASLEHDGVHMFATPRRLAVLVESLAISQQEGTKARSGGQRCL